MAKSAINMNNIYPVVSVLFLIFGIYELYQAKKVWSNKCANKLQAASVQGTVSPAPNAIAVVNPKEQATPTQGFRNRR